MTVPTKWRLAQHWEASEARNIFAPMLESLEHPCCFACGWFSERWTKATPKASWERAALERAHVVPASLGGPDAAENIILLCQPCHLASPDWHESSEMARWIAERPERASKEVEDLGEWIQAMHAVPGFTELLVEAKANPELNDEDAVRRIVDLLRASTRRASVHAGTLSPGTKAAILRDATIRSSAGDAAA